MTTARLALHDLSCVRGGRLLFRGIALELGPGEAALVTGPNGAGKSSLLRIAAGLLPPTTGHVERVGAIALADERLALDATQTLARALLFWARLDGTGADAVVRALDRTGLGHLADVPVRMLSTGQRKRAVLARTIASAAPIWLLDEPANGLDAEAVARLGTIMADHRADGGVILAATHQPIGLDMATSLAIMPPDDDADADGDDTDWGVQA